ncbi:uncharacterized protein MELLADRAFT_59115 [Melampsora larici-populina 98AG31]|uniref:Secreted protein n=1 Tax=Melampsora larici-populina (strain 98AG31 / pathotype 3-4-7) TaxID=747676 RepID=F4R531_MELLP|nr:uncharacterized protein MELLADRAFT_59115 [Melampsora larici-populina 98AG31]EGG12343.1 secreted protein [Melampsora larici-populina 98AG31]
MKPLVLGLYAYLAYCVHSGIVEFSQAASSSYVPPAMGSDGWNSGTASGVKWNPAVEKMFEGWREGQTLRLRYNRRDKVFSADPQAMEGRRMLHDRKMQQVSQSSKGFETTTLKAPSQPGMSRTEYTEEELHHIAKEVNKKTDGLHYKYNKDSKILSMKDKSLWDVSGFCGRIKVFDSENPEQLIYETSCCHCRHPRSGHEWTVGECCVVMASMITPTASCYYCERCGELLGSVSEGISQKLKTIREEREQRRAISQIHPEPST